MDPSLNSTLRGYLQAIRECDAPRMARFLDPAGLNRHQKSLQEILAELVPYGQEVLLLKRLGVADVAELGNLTPLDYGARLIGASVEEVREADPRVQILSVREEEDQAWATYSVEMDLPEFGLYRTESEIALQRRGTTWYACFEVQALDAWVARMRGRIRSVQEAAGRDRLDRAFEGEPLEPFAIWGVRDFDGAVLLEPAHEEEEDLDDFPGIEECEVEAFALWGFRNGLGQTVLEPRFQRAEPFSEGLAAVRLLGRWGYVSSVGELVVKPVFAGAGPFSDGLAATATGDPLERTWGYIDATGAFVVEPRFERAGPFRQGRASVSLAGKPGTVDSSGAFEPREK